jgi:hypothetical protein
MRHPTRRAAFSAIEMLVVIGIFTVVSIALYSFFSHYTRTFVRIDERLEQVVEAWQVLRHLGDDLQSVDFPDGDRARWADILQRQPDGFIVQTRTLLGRQAIQYRFDPASGNLVRVEGGKTKLLLQNRCKAFEVQMQHTLAAPATMPIRLEFQVKLVLQNPKKTAETTHPLEMDTILIPEFLNRTLTRRYHHTGLP